MLTSLYLFLPKLAFATYTPDADIQAMGTTVVNTFIGEIKAFLTANTGTIIAIAAFIFVITLAVRLGKRWIGGR